MRFRRFIGMILVFCILFGLCGCQQPQEENNPPVKDDITTMGQGQQEILYQQLFDPNSKIQIQLDMSDAELQKLQNDYENYYKSPIYRKADVTFTVTANGKTQTYQIPEVGVRMKGNTSRTDFYNQNDGIYNYIHLKLDFQETFDDAAYYGTECNTWASEALRQARKDRTFATLEKLELRWNKNYDSTYLREAYAYDIYRSVGVLAPHAALGAVTWNGLAMGIYTLQEPVDKVFIERNLPEKDWDGDLYKLGWTNQSASFTSQNSIGIENEENNEFYVYDLKTNKKTSQHESLKALLTGLNNGSVTKEIYSQLVDVEYFLRYAAVSYLLGNPDDLRNNYNNCYLYFLKSSGKAIIIPYDYDRCLGITVDYNPSGHAMTKEDVFSDRAEGMQNGPQPQESPLYLYSVVKGGFYVREFAQVLEQVMQNELFTPEAFEARYNIAAALYADDVSPERSLHNAQKRDFGFSLIKTDDASGSRNMSFKDYITAKMHTARNGLAKVEEAAGYVRPVPATFFIRGDFNGWSNEDRYGMEAVDGKQVYTLTINREFSFKVYDNINQEWYGTDFFPEDIDLDYRTNDHANVILGPGTYEIVFDPEYLTLYVTKQ